MDYEQKYKEALELARDYYKANLKLDKADENLVLEDIFPELKESEDEKIRKALLEMVHDTTGDELWVNYNVHKEEALAWLEKQGEQKSFDYENANIQQKDFAPQEDAPRYSIGDVLCDKSCTTLDKDAQPNYEIVDIRNGLYICDKGYIPISQQDEYELVAKKIEQKPAWSEEDDYNLQCCIAKVQFDIDNGRIGRNRQLLTWLKSLKERVQPQLKQEWSEEDEEELDIAISTLKEAGQHDSAKWLKSLKQRHTWKPTKKQIDALLFVVQHYTPNVTDKLAWDSIKILELMYHEINQ